MNRFFPSLSLVVFMVSPAIAQDGEGKDANRTFNGSPVVADAASLTLIDESSKFTEGPARDASGDVYFTDQPNDRILHWSAASGEVSVFMSPCGRSNGLYIGRDGQLLACADEKNELWRIDMESKEKEVLLARYDDKRFNGPNDVWVLPNGDLYFTDPFYKRPYWEHSEREQDGQHVYFLKKGSQRPRRVADDLVQPNGIIGDVEKGVLYVADIGDKKTYRYTIADDGSLTNRHLLIEMGSDGMTLDATGNLYLTGKGVTVVSPAGKRIEHIPVPEGWTANVCFGGKTNKTLFITAMDSAYTLAMQVEGLPWPK